MSTRFGRHDTLRLFIEIAKHTSLSDAADALNMTKGAVSYQIKSLEAELDLKVFERRPRGVALTDAGRELLFLCGPHFRNLEADLAAFCNPAGPPLTVGMSSYFASRWLSPRLMTFMQEHPDIRLRIQPMTRLFDLEGQGVDIAIRWGNGDWSDAIISPFMPMPAWPVGSPQIGEMVKRQGLERTLSEFTLLRDHDGSTAWSEWFGVAELPRQSRLDALIIPDPNVRVQAVIDGQGIALMDDLVSRELEGGSIVRLSEAELSAYGYFLAVPPSKEKSETVKVFRDWLEQTALPGDVSCGN